MQLTRTTFPSQPTTLAVLWLIATCGLFAQQPTPAPAPAIHTDRPDSARTLKLPADDSAFTFAIFGDRTGGPAAGIKVLAQGVKDVNLLDPDLVMTVGDLINGYNRAPEWMKQMAEYHSTMNQLDMPWFPVAGNHDVYWRGPAGDRPPLEHEERYEKHFGPFWYWFEHKQCGFLVLYTDEGVPGGTRPKSFGDPEQHRFSPKQLAFLKKALGKMKELQHVFVFLHHPRWRSNYRGSDWDAVVHPLLAETGNVRAVFAGHIHAMTYGGKRDGIEYYSLATTGGGLPRDMISPVTGYLHHFNMVTVRSNGFHMAAIPVGETIDPKTFTPEYETKIHGLRHFAPAFKRGVIMQADGSAEGRIEIEVANPMDHPMEVDLIPDFAHGIQCTPDHASTTLKPNETRRFDFGYQRGADGFAGFKIPRVKFRYDVLFPTSRLSFPERSLPVPSTLDLIDETEIKPARMHLPGRSGIRLEHSQVQLPDGPLTLEAWLKPLGEKQRGVPLAKTESSEYNIELEDGCPVIYLHVSGSYASARAPDPLPTNQWSHVAGVFDGKELRLYVGGKQVAATPAKGPRTPNALPFYIGADTDGRGNPTRFYRGGIDEVRLSKVARYTDAFEPATRHEPDADTVLLFHLDQRIGPFAPAANGVHGVVFGRPKFTPVE